MTKRPPLSLEVSDEILARLENGESLHAIAREYGRYPANLYTLIKRRYGYEFPKRNWYWPQSIHVPEEATTLAYLAGLVDGEGSIRRREDGLWSLKVGMTDEAVIRWLFELIGGSFSAAELRPPRKPVYTWQIAARNDVLALLTAISPYMRVKRELADRVIAELTERVARGFQKNAPRSRLD